MNDYYSWFPQPAVEVRIEDTMRGIPNYLKDAISKRKLRKIVHETVNSSPEYSLTGYRMFGLPETINLSIKAIESARTSKFSCLPF